MTVTGVPIEPRGPPPTGQNFCALAAAWSAGDKLASAAAIFISSSDAALVGDVAASGAVVAASPPVGGAVALPPQPGRKSPARNRIDVSAVLIRRSEMPAVCIDGISL
jgi:hypothetical protein